MLAAGCTEGEAVRYDQRPAAAAVAEHELITPRQGRNQEHSVLEADAM